MVWEDGFWLVWNSILLFKAPMVVVGSTSMNNMSSSPEDDPDVTAIVTCLDQNVNLYCLIVKAAKLTFCADGCEGVRSKICYTEVNFKGDESGCI